MSLPAHLMVLVDTGRGRCPWYVGCKCGWRGTRRRRMKQATEAYRDHLKTHRRTRDPGPRPLTPTADLPVELRP